MPTKNATLKGITSTVDQSDTDIPEWAKSGSDGPSEGSDQPEPDDSDAQGDDDATGSGANGPTVTGVIASATPALDNLIAWLAEEAVEVEEDSMAGLEAIIRQTLSSTDMAATLRQTLPSTAERWLDTPLLLTGYTIRHSDFDSAKGAPFYASLEVTCGEPAEPRVINCGGWRVLAQVKRLVEVGTWPMVIEIREAAKAKKGQNAPLMLVTPDGA